MSLSPFDINTLTQYRWDVNSKVEVFYIQMMKLTIINPAITVNITF